MAKLFFQVYGDPKLPKLVILHGLLGSHRNWLTFAKQICNRYQVYLLDLRNHGSSEFSNTMTYEEMSGDIEKFAQIENLKTFDLMGHSMGGKVAMRFASDHPHFVNRLLIIDIAPKIYEPHYYKMIQFLNGLNLSDFNHRKQLEDSISEIVEDWAFRQFLMTNIKRNNKSEFYWSINLPVVLSHMDSISENPLEFGEIYKGSTFFIIGSNSEFVKSSDHKQIHLFYPFAKILSIQGGHNLHIENKTGLMELLDELH